MFITVAGEKKEVKDGLTLPELIAQENVEMPEYVTVSINEEFVASEDKESTVLKEGDNVEFLYFMGQLSKCIRCNACRNVCPACSCRKVSRCQFSK